MDNQTRLQNPRRKHALKIRETVEWETRRFFRGLGFREVRTPLLVQCPGMETHIRPLKVTHSGRDTQATFLPTSPEFAMKRIVVGGEDLIFQICPAFRDEPVSPHHSPEFTLLEWYRSRKSYTGFENILQDVESLFEHLAKSLNKGSSLKFGNSEINISRPWPRFTTRELFKFHTSLDLAVATISDFEIFLKTQNLSPPSGATWDDLYFLIWLNLIEPRLPMDRPIFVTHYPPSQSALAKKVTDPDGSIWANRFEVYCGGMELANAFDELSDPKEQRHRFEEDMALREQQYGSSFPKNPLDEEFLAALEEGLPPTGGIALGVDRLVMLFADEPELDYTLWQASHWEA